MVKAQDINFSQSYYFKEFINPSFVGLDNCSHIGVNERSIALGFGGINTVRAGLSGFYPNINSGFALLLNNEKHPDNIINGFTLRLAYVYKIKISDKLRIIPSVGIDYSQRIINPGHIVFPSMIDQWGSVGSVNYSSLPDRNLRYMGLDLSLLAALGGFYMGAMVKNVVIYQLGGNSLINKGLSFVMGYDYFSGSVKKYSFILNVKKTQQVVESNISFSWFLSKNFSLSAAVQGINLNGVIASFTGVYRKGRFDWLFSYGFSASPIAFSVYEVGGRYKFNCKKSAQKTINCPAYQF